MAHIRLYYALCGAVIWILSGARALAVELAALDIKLLTLEQLMEIDVYSASRRLESVQDTPSAVYVLTNEDLRRSRALTIPDALRLVPGVQVARVDASRWAVSIRGFNERITHNIQVMIDGRSVYDPLFAGVFWEAQDVMMEDVERIEVVRGPGGTLWGPNAVNGVINIITKHARDTQGGLVSAGVGNEEHAFGAARYGWQARANQHARVYAKTFDRGAGFTSAPEPRDEARMGRAGFRWDWSQGTRDDVTVSGDFYNGDAAQVLPAPNPPAQHIDLRGANLLTRWQRRISDSESLRVQFSYDRTRQDSELVGLDERRDTYDVELQHSLQPASAHRLIWGAGHRRTRDELLTAPAGVVNPARRSDASTYIYLQDTVTLSPDRWYLTAGVKIEETDYSDIESQPNVRLAWTPNPQQTWWAAVSRAVRVPSRLERDLLGGTGLGDQFAPEDVLAYEVGHRRLVTPTVWYDVAGFYNVYNNLRNFEFIPTFPFVQLQNNMQGRTYGTELALRWQATPALRLDTAYTYLQLKLELDPASTTPDAAATVIEESSPAQQLVLRGAYELARRWEIDVRVRFVDKLPAVNIAAYTTLGIGIGWHPRSDLELSLVGQNLLDSQHPEQIFEGANGVATETQRAVYAKVKWTF